MAPRDLGPSPLSALKAIAFRISSTPPEHLPPCVPHITASLAACRELLSSESTPSSKDASDVAVTVHKFKTQLSALLQDRSVHGRWAAVVLIKCTIQLGGWEVLQKCGPWVRGLLNVLTRPDPPTTKNLAVITLTRIFLLSKEYPTLVREVTTPSLVAFVTNCLSVVFPKTLSTVEHHTTAQRALLTTVLESFYTLLPRHPNVFRPFMTQINILVSQCIAPTANSNQFKKTSSTPVSQLDRRAIEAAQILFVRLHHSASKGDGAEEWERSFDSTIKCTHAAADRVFRSVIEGWKSSAKSQYAASAATYDGEVRETDGNALNLPPWFGIYAGSERLVGLLRLLDVFVTTPTAAAVNVRLGLLLDLLSRILSVAIPYEHSEDWQETIQLNPQVEKDERNALWTLLPEIHAVAIEILLGLIERFETTVLPFAHTFLEAIKDLYEAEGTVPLVRTTIFTAISALLQLTGPSLTKTAVDTLSPCIRKATFDLLPPIGKLSSKNSLEKGQTNGTGKLNVASSVHDKAPDMVLVGLGDAAEHLLSMYLSRVPPHLIPRPVRTEVERVATLLQHKQMMLAAVLNPPKKQRRQAPSVLPLLARQHGDDVDLEGILRPRMPVVSHGINLDESLEVEVEEDDEDDEDGRTEGEDESIGEQEQMDSQLAVDDITTTAETPTSYSNTSAFQTISARQSRAAHIPEEQSHSPLLKRTASTSTPGPSSPKRTRLDQQPVSAPVLAVPSPNIILSPEASFQSAATIPIVTGTVPVSDAAGGTDMMLVENERNVDLVAEGSDDDDFGELVIGPDSDDEE